MNNNILISGINGFVGGSLKKHLIKNYNIKGLSRRSNKEHQIICYEELSMDFLNKFNGFIHLAGKAHDLRKGVCNNDYYKANTDLTIYLFDCFLKSNCSVFIYLSSVKAVADKVDGFLTEAHVPNPITAYGKSKLKAEHYMLSKTLPEGKKLYILRPCIIYGPNNKGNLNLIYKFIKKGIPYPLGSFQNKRSFLAITNLCFIIEKLLEIKPSSGIYHVADNTPISTNELVKIIGIALNKKTKIIKIPIPLVTFFARIGDTMNLPFNSESLNKLTQNYMVSNVKIKKVLDIELPISTEEGLKQTIRSFKKP